MPLVANARDIMRNNLERIAIGEKPPTVTVGNLTQAQLTTINKYRTKHGLPPISGEIIFIGRHVHDSRIVEDGYSIEDVLDQIASAMGPESTVINSATMTAIRNPTKRTDRYGNHVRDEAVFECWRHNPKSQLFSVVPRGDSQKPSEIKEAATKEAAPSKL